MAFPASISPLGTAASPARNPSTMVAPAYTARAVERRLVWGRRLKGKIYEAQEKQRSALVSQAIFSTSPPLSARVPPLGSRLMALGRSLSSFVTTHHRSLTAEGG